MKKLPERTRLRIKTVNHDTLMSDLKKANTLKNTKNRNRFLIKYVKVIKLPPTIALTVDKDTRDLLLRTIALLHEKALSFSSMQIKYSKAVLELDFRAVQYMYPSGTLLLLAEINNARHIYPDISFTCKQPPNNTLRQVMCQVGFADVLYGVKKVSITRRTVSMWNCVSGATINAADCRMAIEKCLSAASQDGKELMRSFYNAATEAMVNTDEHAYTKDVPPVPHLRKVDSTINAWWMFACYDSGNICVDFCDLGHGIPQTLPLTNPSLWKKIRSMVGMQQDDALIIEEVLKEQKSRTNKPERGLGLLKNIWNFINDVDIESHVTILSNRGECRKIRRANHEPSIVTKNHPRSINGTIISWSIPVMETKVQE